MNIIFYVNLDEPNTINKELDAGAVLTGALRDETDIINPVFITETDPTAYNYAYIPAFGRYYFFVDVKSVRKNLWRVALKVDVLESFRDDILNLPVIVSGAENGYNKYLPGAGWVANVKHKTDIMQFPSGLDENGHYILITAGG